jgi:hypothetical protein
LNAQAVLETDNKVVVTETIVSTPKSITLKLSISQAATIANLIGNTSETDMQKLAPFYRTRRKVTLMEVYKPLTDALDAAGFRNH